MLLYPAKTNRSSERPEAWARPTKSVITGPLPHSIALSRVVDPASVGSSGDYPLAWAQSFGSGRAYYNALGHFSSTWADARFQRQLAGAIRWAAKR